jgi:hypothetical protein
MGLEFRDNNSLQYGLWTLVENGRASREKVNGIEHRNAKATKIFQRGATTRGRCEKAKFEKDVFKVLKRVYIKIEYYKPLLQSSNVRRIFHLYQ